MLKIAKSLITIIGVSVIAVSATGAYFSDNETVTGNTFAAGSLDLQIAQGNPIPFSISDVTPGQTGQGKITLTNATGSIPADLDIKLSNLIQSENGLIAPELAAGDYENGGDLWISFEMAAYLDVNRDGVFNSGDIQLTYNGQQSAYPGFWGGDFHFHNVTSMLTGWNDIKTLNGGDSVDLVVMWQVPSTWTYPNYSQNIIMTDSLGFDIQTSLEQVGAPGGVTE